MSIFALSKNWSQSGDNSNFPFLCSWYANYIITKVYTLYTVKVTQPYKVGYITHIKNWYKEIWYFLSISAIMSHSLNKNVKNISVKKKKVPISISYHITFYKIEEFE